ncbi:MAG: MmgE/PrpD family protein [Desulfobacterales bacterium]|jgi:2-methylcitrate dehydratase PrpD|nr:MmgE/PrpD family protein [Desulfobacterales bacterium]
MENITRTLAGFAARLTFADLPAPLVRKLKIALLDAIGCGLHGASLPWAEIVNRWVAAQGGTPEATLWGRHFQGPCANVALGLGVMIHGFDFDDYHNAKIHPGAPVIPAAVAVGEALGAAGPEVLAAVAAGYETMIRVSLATGPNASRLKGWHLTGTTGTFGAAAAAGRLLGLSADDMASALGLAGTQSAGLWAFLADGAMSKRFHPGRASQSGVMAAFLAKDGFRGPTRILEAADGGFCRATSDAVDLARATDGLESTFLGTDVNIKPYACCASSHSAVDAVLELRRRHAFSAQEVAAVRVKTARGVEVQCGFDYRPAGIVQAQMSLQYIVAVTLLDGAALLAQFAESRLADPAVLDLARRVAIEVDPDIDRLYPERYANRVEIALKDGRRIECRVDFPKGSGERPLSFAEVAAKFRSLSAGAVSADRADRIIGAVESLDALGDIRGLTRLLE